MKKPTRRISVEKFPISTNRGGRLQLIIYFTLRILKISTHKKVNRRIHVVIERYADLFFVSEFWSIMLTCSRILTKAVHNTLGK